MEATGTRVFVPVDQEQRPDQVVGGEHVLAHHAAAPIRPAVAARAGGEIERRRAGAWPRPGRRSAGFDRAAVFDGHGALLSCGGYFVAVPGSGCQRCVTAFRSRPSRKDGEAGDLRLLAEAWPWHHARPRSHLARPAHVNDRSVQQPAMSDKQLALIVYILYFAGYITGITELIGVIIAHVKIADADPMLRTHYQFQIRTFWIGILYLAIGTVLLFVVVGFAVWLWWFIWSLVRNVKGVLALNENKPIANPQSWMFG